MIRVPAEEIEKAITGGVAHLVERFSSPMFRRHILRSVGNAVAAHWQHIANQSLHTTAHIYTDRVRILSLDDQSVTVGLAYDSSRESLITRIIEEGYGPVDLKPILLKGRPYVNIPFTHTKETVKSFGSLGIARELTYYGSERVTFSGRTTPLRSNPAFYTAPAESKRFPSDEFSSPILKPGIHKSPILAGAVRMRRYGMTPQGVYTQGQTIWKTWRRVSANSDPASWWVWVRPRRFAQEAENRIQDAIHQALSYYL